MTSATAINLDNIEIPKRRPRYNLDADEWKTAPSNQLVFIGRHLDENKIHSRLRECLI